MKTKNYAKLLSWEAGLDPNDLRYINFRDKDPNKDKNAADYNFFGNDSQKSRSRKKSSLKAANYNIPHLKFKACDFCEDVFGYCADVVTGDAWINPYVKNPRGTNVLITRNARLHDLILQFRGDQLDLDDISEEQLIESQSSSFSHRIEEIGYRLFKSKKENQWSPNKASSEKRLKENRESIQNLREEIREKSHKYFKEALDNNDLASYFNEVNPLVEKLNSFYG
jgi:coenzyme F420 hydrogenase subunit beta